MWEEGARIYGTPGIHNNFQFTTFLQQILSDMLLLVIIVGAKK